MVNPHDLFMTRLGILVSPMGVLALEPSDWHNKLGYIILDFRLPILDWRKADWTSILPIPYIASPSQIDIRGGLKSIGSPLVVCQFSTCG